MRSLKMYRILIVDDHADQREFLQFLLTSHNADWIITEASNGKEALTLCQNETFDFLITDVKMPFLSGIELAESLRKIGVELPILFISGYDDFQYVKKALTLQAIDYLLKPINPSDFHHRLDSMITDYLSSKEEKAHLIEIQRLQKQQIITNILHGVSAKELSHKEQSFTFIEKFRFLFLIEANTKDITTLENFFQINEENHYFTYRVSRSRLLLLHTAKTLGEAVQYMQRLEQLIPLKTGKNYTLERSEFISDSESFLSCYQKTEQKIAKNFYRQTPTSAIDVPLPTQEALSEIEVFQKVKSYIQQYNLIELERFTNNLLVQYKVTAYESPMITKLFFTNLYKAIIETSDISSQKKEEELQTILQATRFSEIEPLFKDLFNQLKIRQQAIDTVGNDYVREAKKYILNHYQEELNLETLAKVINISPKYLSELFIREENIGISKYLKQVRLKKAQDLLRNSRYRVREVSELVGFNNYSYFIRNFRESVGVTPDVYRKTHHQVDI